MTVEDAIKRLEYIKANALHQALWRIPPIVRYTHWRSSSGTSYVG